MEFVTLSRKVDENESSYVTDDLFRTTQARLTKHLGRQQDEDYLT